MAKLAAANEAVAPAALSRPARPAPAVPQAAPRLPRLRVVAALVAPPAAVALLTSAAPGPAVAGVGAVAAMTAVLLYLVDGFTPNAYTSAAEFGRAVAGVGVVGTGVLLAVNTQISALGGATVAAALPASALLAATVVARAVLISACRNRPVRALVLGHSEERPIEPHAEHVRSAVVVVERIELPDPSVRVAERIACQRPDVVLVEAPVAELDFGLLRLCSEHAIRVLVLVRPPYSLATGRTIVRLGGLPWVPFAPFALAPRHVRAKRGLDLVLVLLGAPLLAPLMALVALAVVTTSRGGAIYRQRRVGANGRVFWLYKFRTMHEDAERETGPVLAAASDPRVTRVGGILRRFRIDELPQLWNVIGGEMSLVGPRPERPELVRRFALVPEYEHRHLLRPGITGLAQLVGGYSSGPVDKLRCDLLYVSSRTLRLDLRLICSTLLLFLRGFPVD